MKCYTCSMSRTIVVECACGWHGQRQVPACASTPCPRCGGVVYARPRAGPQGRRGKPARGSVSIHVRVPESVAEQIRLRGPAQTVAAQWLTDRAEAEQLAALDVDAERRELASIPVEAESLADHADNR